MMKKKSLSDLLALIPDISYWLLQIPESMKEGYEHERGTVWDIASFAYDDDGWQVEFAYEIEVRYAIDPPSCDHPGRLKEEIIKIRILEPVSAIYDNETTTEFTTEETGKFADALQKYLN